jgi:hypothetical protein
LEFRSDRFLLETLYGVSAGKYTIGLGQKQMAFAGDSEGKNILYFKICKKLNNIQIFTPSA